MSAKGKQPELAESDREHDEPDISESDDEGEDHDEQEGNQAEPEGNLVAKKRNRTLTTPHQAAVLNALLAQTRFPSTEMREEVGQQINMSARRVQIWFQNRRQSQKKAREREGAAGGMEGGLGRPSSSSGYGMDPGAMYHAAPPSHAYGGPPQGYHDPHSHFHVPPPQIHHHPYYAQQQPGPSYPMPPPMPQHHAPSHYAHYGMPGAASYRSAPSVGSSAASIRSFASYDSQGSADYAASVRSAPAGPQFPHDPRGLRQYSSSASFTGSTRSTPAYMSGPPRSIFQQPSSSRSSGPARAMSDRSPVSSHYSSPMPDKPKSSSFSFGGGGLSLKRKQKPSSNDILDAALATLAPIKTSSSSSSSHRPSSERRGSKTEGSGSSSRTGSLHSKPGKTTLPSLSEVFSDSPSLNPIGAMNDLTVSPTSTVHPGMGAPRPGSASGSQYGFVSSWPHSRPPPQSVRSMDTSRSTAVSSSYSRSSWAWSANEPEIGEEGGDWDRQSSVRSSLSHEDDHQMETEGAGAGKAYYHSPPRKEQHDDQMMDTETTSA